MPAGEYTCACGFNLLRCTRNRNCRHELAGIEHGLRQRGAWIGDKQRVFKKARKGTV